MKTSRMFKGTLAAIGALVLAVSMTACGSTTPSDGAAAESVTEPQTDEPTPLLASILEAPIPVKGSDDLMHVVYEIQVLNASPRSATLTKVETVGDNGRTLHTLQREDLANRVLNVGESVADRTSITTIEPGRTVVLLMDDTYQVRSDIPEHFTHRLHATLSGGNPSAQSRYPSSLVERTGAVTLGDGEPVKLSPPLAGANWLAANACCGLSSHRGAMLPLSGRLNGAERYAIDWLRVDPELDPAQLPPDMIPSLEGDASDNASYLAYDQPLLAVADGTVVKVVDGMPDQVPQTSDHRLSFDELGGNHLVLDIGDGFYAFYGHVAPGTFQVEEGDHVEVGSVLGHLGNSGNTSEAHLHFHVMRGPAPLAATNWPYEFTYFDITGTLTADGRNVTDTVTAGSKTAALPLQLNVVTFPG